MSLVCHIVENTMSIFPILVALSLIIWFNDIHQTSPCIKKHSPIFFPNCSEPRRQTSMDSTNRLPCSLASREKIALESQDWRTETGYNEGTGKVDVSFLIGSPWWVLIHSYEEKQGKKQVQCQWRVYIEDCLDSLVLVNTEMRIIY